MNATDKQFVERVSRWRTSTPEKENIAKIQNIIVKLTLHEEHNGLIYVGKNYSKADLVKELRALQENKNEND